MNSVYAVNQSVASEIVWVDIETLGLDEELHPIIELGCIVTDRFGEERARFSSLIGYSESYLATRMTPSFMGEVVWKMHTENNLLDEVAFASKQLEAGDSSYHRVKVESQVISWLNVVTANPVGQQLFPLAGASIHFDRRFLSRQMPLLEAWFHYRNYDVSSILKFGEFVGARCDLAKRNIHRALPDLEDEISAHRWAVAKFSGGVG